MKCHDLLKDDSQIRRCWHKSFNNTVLIGVLRCEVIDECAKQVGGSLPRRSHHRGHSGLCMYIRKTAKQRSGLNQNIVLVDLFISRGKPTYSTPCSLARSIESNTHKIIYQCEADKQSFKMRSIFLNNYLKSNLINFPSHDAFIRTRALLAHDHTRWRKLWFRE